MPEKLEKNVPLEKPKQGISILEILARLDTTDDEQIVAFRETLPLKQQVAFDQGKPKEKKILTLLANCSTEEIKFLIELQNKNSRLPGLHDVKNYLYALRLLTGKE